MWAPNLTLQNPPDLINPSVIIEVLSTTTEADDRYLKLPRLMEIEGLKEIIIVGSNRISIEQYVRKGGEWVVQPMLQNLQERLLIPTVQVEVPLADMYDGVQFPPVRV